MDFLQKMVYKVLLKNRFRLGDYELAPIQAEDMEPIRSWRNNQIEVLRQANELTKEVQQAYFSNVVSKLFSENEPSQLLFRLSKGDELVAYGGLVHLSWRDRRAEMSFLADNERANDKIIYQEDFINFIALIKELCFLEMDFNRLYTETYEFRSFHISILEKGGFKEEARLRQNIFEHGRFYDSIFHSILREEYSEE